jgi:hypothetical protein
MVKVQNWKIYPVHFGIPDSEMRKLLMQAASIQVNDKNMGMPVTNACLA